MDMNVMNAVDDSRHKMVIKNVVDTFQNAVDDFENGVDDFENVVAESRNEVDIYMNAVDGNSHESATLKTGERMESNSDETKNYSLNAKYAMNLLKENYVNMKDPLKFLEFFGEKF